MFILYIKISTKKMNSTMNIKIFFKVSFGLLSLFEEVDGAPDTSSDTNSKTHTALKNQLLIVKVNYIDCPNYNLIHFR